MRATSFSLILATLIAGMFGQAVTAQIPVPGETILNFQYEFDEGFVQVEYLETAFFRMEITDTSLDRPDPNSGGPTPHFFTFGEIELFASGGEPAASWIAPVPFPTVFALTAGQTQVVTFEVLHGRTTTERLVQGRGTLEIREPRTGGLNVTRSFEFGVQILPLAAVNLVARTGSVPDRIAPGSTVVLPFEVTNPTLYTQRIQMTATVDPESGLTNQDLGLSGGGTMTLRPFETRTINFMVIAPRDQFYFQSESYFIIVRAEPTENPSAFEERQAVIMVNGFNWQPSTLILVAVLLLILAVALLFVLFAKRHYQERILGKPIPPWKIPEEAANLETLRKEDPRKFYVLRYFLMEEEYESALLWFHSYKKRSKRELRHARRAAKYEERAENLKEFKGDRYDRRAARWTAYYEWRKRRRERWRDRKVHAMQTRLDKHHAKDYEKDHKKWEKRVEALTNKANKPVLKEHKKWEKEKSKAVDAWESEVAKLQEKFEKELAAAQDDYEKSVKKEDKDAWKAWKTQMADVQSENKVRQAEGREAVPLPKLLSEKVPEPDWPQPPKLPAKPRLPPEPKMETPTDLPPEPTLAQPELMESKYAKKVKRKQRKAARKLARLDKRLAKRLAKVERKRAKKATKAFRKRQGYIVDAQEAYRPSLLERTFRLTPEAHERRARKKLVKALHDDELQHFADAEESRLDRLKADLARQEAEFEAKIIRDRASVRTRRPAAGKEVSAAEVQKEEAALQEMRTKNKEKIAKAKAESDARVEAEAERLWQSLAEREGLKEDAKAKSKPKSGSTKKSK